MDAGSAGAMRGLFLNAQPHRARMPRVPRLRVIEDCDPDIIWPRLRLNHSQISRHIDRTSASMPYLRKIGSIVICGSLVD
jgi:hypothetical protein